jgi:hypothetical protein
MQGGESCVQLGEVHSCVLKGRGRHEQARSLTYSIDPNVKKMDSSRGNLGFLLRDDEICFGYNMALDG